MKFVVSSKCYSKHGHHSALTIKVNEDDMREGNSDQWSCLSPQEAFHDVYDPGCFAKDAKHKSCQAFDVGDIIHETILASTHDRNS